MMLRKKLILLIDQFCRKRAQRNWRQKFSKRKKYRFKEICF